MNKTVFEARGEQLIAQKGMSKAEFARRVGIQRQNVRSLFRSHNLETMIKVADVLEVPLSELIGYVEPIDFDNIPYDRIDVLETNSEQWAEISPEDIPTGNSTEDRRERKKIIFDFYQKWKAVHPEQALYNIELKEMINIRAISIEETAAHASLQYLSTLAVFQLDAILTNAKTIAVKQPKAQTKNQRQFEKMLLMEYECVGVGKVKLTVGVKRSDKSKIQYCITALKDEGCAINKTKQTR